MMETVIGRLHHVIVDCPDPAGLAAFYSELLGFPITWQEYDFVVVSRDGTSSGIAFQLAPGLQPPQWPDPGRPQQMHFDVMVDDVDDAELRVLALGARRLPGPDGRSRVYADPAGHPFVSFPGRRGLRRSENHLVQTDCPESTFAAALDDISRVRPGTARR
jgi:catechol 2,3-dioxygenase-like lactoylglutathione lyase family enzyme